MWVTSNITQRTYLVEIVYGEGAHDKALFTRIFTTGDKSNLFSTGIIRLSAGINPLPFVEQLDKMN